MPIPADRRIDVSVVRQAMEDSDATLYEVATNMGWMRMKGHVNGNRYYRPDTTRVKKALGLVKDGGGFNKYLDIERAVRLVLAMNLDPDDYGI